jgi:hypothetical protein
MTKTILKSKNAFEKICNKKFTYQELGLLATSNKFLSEKEKLQKKVVQNKMHKLKIHGLSVQNYEAVILMIEVELGPKAVKHRGTKISNFKDRQTKAMTKDAVYGAVTDRVPCNCENKCTMPKTVKSNTFGLLHKQTNRIKIIGSLEKTKGYFDCLCDHKLAQPPFIKVCAKDYQVVEVFYKVITKEDFGFKNDL